ncbi:MAG: arylsulfatase [Verrucomicrobiales bacterium]|nr:arylsulfatase [Verrucomicrobiales bacterium]
MNPLILISLPCYVAILVLATAAAPVANRVSQKPNIVLILADDLGFSDLGSYGSEIETPNLDSLASGGLRFTQFYNTARCWPSRAALLTGYYAQQVRRDAVPGVRSGGQGIRPSWARLLPEMLKPLGYRSYHSGKWHVDGAPLQQGFSHSYRLEDHDRNFYPKLHFEDDKPLPPVQPGTGYYTSTAITDHALKCLDLHSQTQPGQPFFSFVAYTSPHFPLQAPEQDVAKYKDRYLSGWDKLREQRWQRLRAMGLVDGHLSAPEREVGPPYAFPEAITTLGSNEVNRAVSWDSLTLPQRRFQADKMAVHAAMVDRMDQEIGRIMNRVRSLGQWENTLFLFLSDNGASAEMMVRGDGHDTEAVCGTGATFLSLGPGWSTMANTPFRRHKTWVHEGGISTPLIMHWPQGIPLSSRGTLRHSPGHLVDLVPTLLEVAGGRSLDTWNGEPVPRPPGVSFLPVLNHDRAVDHPAIWWLHENNRALRLGDWKIVASGANGDWELYHLSVDRTETQNLAQIKPEKLKELSLIWSRMTSNHTMTARSDSKHPTTPSAGRVQ